jgi:hypothetical protein
VQSAAFSARADADAFGLGRPFRARGTPIGQPDNTHLYHFGRADGSAPAARP